MTLIFTKQQKQAMLDAVANLSCTPQHLLIDAMKLPTPIPQTSIIKGDAKSVSISAASIIAKVTRDRMMKELGESILNMDLSNIWDMAQSNI